MHGVGAPKKVGADFGDPQVAHLALRDQFCDGTDGVFVGHFGIRPAGLIEVDHLDTEPL